MIKPRGKRWNRNQKRGACLGGRGFSKRKNDARAIGETRLSPKENEGHFKEEEKGGSEKKQARADEEGGDCRLGKVPQSLLKNRPKTGYNDKWGGNFSRGHQASGEIVSSEGKGGRGKDETFRPKLKGESGCQGKFFIIKMRGLQKQSLSN